MNIWLIQIGETLPIDSDIYKLRTALIAEKLVDRGHSILWWASAFDHLKKKWVFNKDQELKLKENMNIHILKGIGYKKNVSLSRYIDHRIIAKKFKKIAYKLPTPDFIVTSMPSYDLAFEAVSFAKKNRIPILVDIRDQWPDIFFNHIPSIAQGLAKYLLNNDFKMLKELMINADGLTSMMQSLLDWGLKYASRQPTWKDKVFYLGSKRTIESVGQSTKISKLLKNHRDKFIVTFIGTFAAYHEPSILLKCAQILSCENIYFVLAGDGELFHKIEKKAIGLPNVLLPGWLDKNDIYTLLRYSHIGICPASGTNTFFPNKSFLFLSSGLPIISAFQGELKDFIRKFKIGFYYPPNDVETLVSCIKQLYENHDLYIEMSENAKRIFDEKFDADKIYEDYAKHIEKVACKSELF